MSRARMLCLTLVGVLASVTLVSAPAAAATLTVSGVVRDAAGMPVSGLQVQARQAGTISWDSDITAADGSYAVTAEQGELTDLLVEGIYLGGPMSAGTNPFTLAAARTENLTLPEGATIEARVTEGDDGSPSPDALVLANAVTRSFPTSGGLTLTTRVDPHCATGSDGSCSLRAFRGGAVAKFQVDGALRPGEQYSGMQTPDVVNHRSFVLAAAPTVSGVVRDAAGAALAGAVVELRGSQTEPTTTAANGSYSLRSVPGPVRLRVRAPAAVGGWSAVPFELESEVFHHDSARTENVSVPALTTARIAVQESTGAPLPGASVTMTEPSSTLGGVTTSGLQSTSYLYRANSPLPRCVQTDSAGICEVPVFVAGTVGAFRVAGPLGIAQDFGATGSGPEEPRQVPARLIGYASTPSAGDVVGVVQVRTEAPVDVVNLVTHPVSLPAGMAPVVGQVDYRIALAPGASRALVRIELPLGATANSLVQIAPDGSVRDVADGPVIQGRTGYFEVVDGSVADQDGLVNGEVVGGVVPVRRDPVVIETATLPAAAVNKPFSVTLSGSGPVPPYTWSLRGGSLPPGLVLGSSGVIHGVPTALGDYSFTVEMRESTGSDAVAVRTLRLSVASIAVTTTSLPDGYAGSAYSTTLKSTGGAFLSWKLVEGALPTGLKLTSGGTLSGAATTPGVHSFGVTVTSGGKSSPVQRLTLTVRPMEVGTTSLPDAPIAAAYSHRLTAKGGKATLVWSTAGGNLPPGLTMNSGGTISGRPTVVGTYSVTVKVADGSTPKQVATRVLTITVTPMEILTATLPVARKGAYYAATLVASGGKPTLSWTLAEGTLPTGLRLSTAGRITGYPTLPGSWTFTVRVADASVPKNQALRTFTLTVT